MTGSAFLEKTAGFRRIDLHWCLTLEPSKLKAFERKPQENAADTSRMLAELQKTATILEGHLGSLLGLRLLDKNSTFQFFCYLFNLEEWAAAGQLRDDTGVDRQIVNNPGCMAQRSSARRQTLRADVLAEDDAGGVEAVPLLRPADARLRQRAVLDMAAQVHRRGPQRDRRAGEVHLLFQSRRADARDERARYGFARNRRGREGRQQQRR